MRALGAGAGAMAAASAPSSRARDTVSVLPSPRSSDSTCNELIRWKWKWRESVRNFKQSSGVHLLPRFVKHHLRVRRQRLHRLRHVAERAEAISFPRCHLEREAPGCSYVGKHAQAASVFLWSATAIGSRRGQAATGLLGCCGDEGIWTFCTLDGEGDLIGL